MKAISVKLVDLEPMSSTEARANGYKVSNSKDDVPGYKVLYQDGYASWAPKNIVEEHYFMLKDGNNGDIITQTDVRHFMTDQEVYTIGSKTTAVNQHTLTGFDVIETSSCVDAKKYNKEIGAQYATERVIDKLWSHLGFVLQWARNGIKN